MCSTKTDVSPSPLLSSAAHKRCTFSPIKSKGRDEDRILSHKAESWDVDMLDVDVDVLELSNKGVPDA